MLLGPLFHVEMVTVARRRRYFVLRTLYGLVALFMLWAAYQQAQMYSVYRTGGVSQQQGAMLATGFFMTFSWLQMLVIMIIGPALAVGTIASERERRTIEYLFTTDLSNSEIILGKLAARLCLFGQIILVGLPILFIFRLLGGIPAHLLMVTFLMAGSASLLIASLSICVSVWSERTRDATIRVYVILGALIFLPMIFMSLLSNWAGANPLWRDWVAPTLEFCTSINPLWGLASAIGNSNAIGINLDMQAIWLTVGKQLLVSSAAIGLAIFAVRRVHLKESSKSAQQAMHRRWFKFQLPKWRRPLGEDPMIWKEVFAGSATTKLGVVGRIAAGLILLTAFGMMVSSAYHELMYSHLRVGGAGMRLYLRFHSEMIGVSGCLGTGILLLLAARASGLMASEKENDSWLSLIATPLTGRDIVRGKMRGNLYSMRWPCFVLFSIWGMGVLLDFRYLLAAATSLGTFLLLACYTTYLGLHFSLRSKTSLRAMGATLGTLIFTGGGYMFCCCMVGVAGPAGGDDFLIFLAGAIPFLLSFPSIVFITNSLSMGDTETSMAVAYGLGIIGYSIATICLYTAMTGNFDRLAGRTNWRPEGSSS